MLFQGCFGQFVCFCGFDGCGIGEQVVVVDCCVVCDDVGKVFFDGYVCDCCDFFVWEVGGDFDEKWS